MGPPVPQPQFQHVFPNGLTLLGEHLPHVRSASMYFMLPAGYAFEPGDRLGLASVLCEMLPRGAGDRDSKALATALDNLGADTGDGAGGFNLTLSAGTLARNLPAVLSIYADIVRRPWLPAAEVDAARELALQDLQGLADSPAELCLLELRRRYYPAPLNRSHYGDADGVAAVTAADVTAFHARRFKPHGAILSVAGNIDWPALVDRAGNLFGDWAGSAEPTSPTVEPNHAPTSVHVPKDTNQTQISIAYPTAPFGSADFYLARGAVNVLSGGMSSRLFTEVREKRGLSYSVSASYDLVKDRAAVVCYAGTRAEKAQQTLDVAIGELKRLKDGIADDEVERVKAGLKTSLIMQQESTSARAGAMATDWFYLRRVRPLDEIQAAVDALTPAAILAHLDRYPAKDFTVVTLGPQPLKIPE